MTVRAFKKEYAAQLARGQKAFDTALMCTAIAVILFSAFVWYLPNELNVYAKISLVVAIFYLGLLLGVIAQIARNAKGRSVITKETSTVYFKYISIKFIFAFCVISALYGAVTALIMVLV